MEGLTASPTSGGIRGVGISRRPCLPLLLLLVLLLPYRSAWLVMMMEKGAAVVAALVRG